MPRTHTIHTDLYLLIDEAGSAEAEVTCRVSYTYHPGAPAYTPRGEYALTEPPLEDVRIEILTDYDGDGQPVWALLQGRCTMRWYGI